MVAAADTGDYEAGLIAGAQHFILVHVAHHLGALEAGLLKQAGFEGTEMMSHMDQDEVLRARDKTGLVIPSVCGRDHWSKPLSSPDSKVRAEGLESLQQTLRDAKRYGASSVLLVPAVVNK